jgi:hypothetical protein
VWEVVCRGLSLFVCSARHPTTSGHPGDNHPASQREPTESADEEGVIKAKPIYEVLKLQLLIFVNFWELTRILLHRCKHRGRLG